jgi:hypothetical protein
MTPPVEEKGVGAISDELVTRALDGLLPNGHRVWAYVASGNPDPNVSGREVMRVALGSVLGAQVWNGPLYERAYRAGYRAALGAAAAECRRQSEALDHGGNTYVRYGDATRCASAVSGLRVPSIEYREPDTNVLHALDEYLRIRADVIDGDCGQPDPNEEMNLRRELHEYMAAIGVSP